MEKLKCIKNNKTGEVLRLNESYASKKVINDEWHYTSKSVYKRYLDEVTKPHYTAGEFNSSLKVSKKAIAFNGNNRKTTRGRKVYYQDISGKLVKFKDKAKKVFIKSVKVFNKSYGFDIHGSETFTSKPDPILGGVTKSKKGNAFKLEEVITINKGDTIPVKTKTIKHYIKPDSKFKMREDGKSKKR